MVITGSSVRIGRTGAKRVPVHGHDSVVRCLRQLANASHIGREVLKK